MRQSASRAPVIVGATSQVRRYRDPLRDAYLVASAVYVLAIASGVVGMGIDGHAYWALQWPHPYPQTYGELSDGFNYSPVAAMVFLPFTALPWPVFHAGLTALSLAALYGMTGRYAVAAILLPPVAIEIFAANLNLVLAASIVLAFRYPGAWALTLLTKVAPGIGVLWFALRREWRAFAIALGCTAVLVAVSFVVAPSAWADWIGYLRANANAAPLPNSLAVPFLARLPFAALVLLIAALTNRRWLVPVACVVAMPVIWPATFSLLVACWPLRPRT